MYLRNHIWAEINVNLGHGLIWFIVFYDSWLSYQVFEKPFMQYRIQK